MARPTDYTEELADRVCEHIASGKSLVSFCKMPCNPSYTSITKYLNVYPEFAAKYTHAREAQAEFLADELVAIADDISQDIGRDEKGNPIIDGFSANRAKVMIDTRKWIASKLKPKKYGEAMTMRGDKENPLVVIGDAERRREAEAQADAMLGVLEEKAKPAVH